MQYPKISIVTPNYNKADYLEDTINSVLSQDYPNLEYIIIDGGSTDGSVNIIKRYENRLKYWCSEPDLGMYYAIKKGFDHSTGDLMAWINSDDMYHRNSFFTVADIFETIPSCNWLTGAVTSYDEKGRTVSSYKASYFSHLDFMLRNYRWIQQESTFWRRSLYEQSGGINTDYKLAGDFDLWMRFSRLEKMYITDALIGGFRHSANQLSHNISLYEKEVSIIIDNESFLEGEAKSIKRIRLYNCLLKYIQRLKILNSTALKNKLFLKKEEEDYSHRLYYDFVENKFRSRL